MGYNYPRAKGRASSGQFLALPHSLLTHFRFFQLSSTAVHMLITLGAQYNGRNNGDLCASISVLKKQGWNSNSKIRNAMDELLNEGFVIKTRQGGVLGACHLWALTFRRIDDCKKILDVQPTNSPLNYWKDPAFKQKRNYPKTITMMTLPLHHEN
jgi:hypothetical protein